MPYSNDLKDPVKRENLPFKYAKRAEQTQLLTTICNRKDTSMDEEEGDCESDEAQQYMNDNNRRVYAGAQGNDTYH